MDKKYIEIDFMVGSTIEECVNELLKYKKSGKLAFGIFSGHKLYSDTVTLDNAYKEITGKTKKEYDEELKRQSEEYKRQEEEYAAKIPSLTTFWIEKGKEILDEEKWDFWSEIVPIRLNDLYKGKELECCLDIVKILNNNGTLEEAREKISSQGHSGMSFGLVRAMVVEFCSRGKEFADFVN